MKHFLIVGGGLAGISVAIRLLEAGQQITIIDDGKNASSIIAAGMVNPMVFRRMNKSWRLDEMTDEAIVFYKNLEIKFKAQFYIPLVIRRLFASEEERLNWNKRLQNPDYVRYLSPLTEEDEKFSKAINTFGTGRVKTSFWINTNSFIHSAHQFFIHNNQLKVEDFDWESFSAESKTYKGISFDSVIFCTGYRNFENKLFDFLPVNPTKGQVLTVHSNEFPIEESLNRKVFILPVGDEKFRIGATYEWHQTDLNPTEEARNELVEKLNSLTNLPYQIVDQRVGIRPTISDRRPLLGEHPNYKDIFIFNGLGTKGYMIAPLLSKELSDLILHQKPVNKEVNPNRFNKNEN